MGILTDPNCFWSFLETHPKYGFCENQICSIVQQPANTWSNIGYLIAAIMIWKAHDKTMPRVKNLFFYSTLSLFVGSSLFHASATTLGHIADVVSMFFVSLTALTLACERYYGWTAKKGYLFFIVNLVLSTAILVATRQGSPLFALQIFITVFYEYRMRNSDKKLNIKRVVTALVCQSIAFIIWILDVEKIVCDPENHFISGHAVWHLMSAYTIYIFYKAYEKIQISA
ncbi:MAG: ceramidase domain-containing protein [Pseudobdellovibrio sp.]